MAQLEPNVFDRYENRRILDFVLRCQNDLNLDKDGLLERMRISPTGFERFLKGKYQLNVLEFGSFLSSLRLTFEAFADKKVDMIALKEHYLGNSQHIPESYLNGAYSKRVAIIHVLNYLTKKYGPYMSSFVLRYFQLPDSFYSEPYADISVTLVQDVLTFLKKYGIVDDDIFSIGIFSVENNQNKQLAEQYHKCKTPQNIYKLFFEEIVTTVDKNNIYKIKKSTPDYCIVESYENVELLDLHHVKNIAGKERCYYRAGILCAMTGYLGLPYAKVMETSCVHRGDRVCTYYVDHAFSYRQKFKLAGSYQ